MSQRLDNALRKLYRAFNDGALHPECCKQCAVGNILDNSDGWKYLTDLHGSMVLNYVGMVNQNFGRRFNGYTPLELLQIEAEFLKGCGYSLPIDRNCKKPNDPTDKETLFNGLSKTVEYLCKLDGIENVMDYSKLFEFESDQPKYELSEMI
ncbi:MAG TPA: Na(+)-translocating NADH-quinone reductase subunit F [Flavobacteriaceae bacterium]